ncbi:endoglucanase [Methylomarinovum tepidoasis]|uniref:Glucanase n=2 Tax=Methylomarinovum tepidoasis TaxID=2840183 RepID=A0AAU9C8C4_9GAMM|nr:endoglucanase [Methylomarinovum sp. IN45]
MLGFALGACTPSTALDRQWRTYKQRFIQDGRVVDTGNGGISHSEGQGYAMLLAVAADDRRTFERLWSWTRNQLQRRGDHLFIWRRRPGVPVEKEDHNNATDGDLLIAWALLRAAQRWNRPTWRTDALAILQDLKKTGIREWRNRPVMLPGAAGFVHPDHLTLNLSYWVFPALRDFYREDGDPLWPALSDSGLNLLQAARFGSWQLPSDWIAAGESLAPDPDHPPRFGYDAVRIPLYLIWGNHDNPEILTPFIRFWNQFDKFLPPWVDLEADCLAAYQAPRGIRNVRSLTLYAAGRNRWPALSPLAADDDYYSASLTLLAHLALAHER